MKDLEKAAADQYATLKKLQEAGDKREAQIMEKVNAEREAAFKKPFNRDNPDREVNLHKGLQNVTAYDYTELEQIFQYSEKAETLRDWLEINGQEMRMKLNTIDWLHIYAESISSYDMDMNATFRYTCNPTRG